jgi:hypothetical protein
MINQMLRIAAVAGYAAGAAGLYFSIWTRLLG